MRHVVAVERQWVRSMRKRIAAESIAAGGNGQSVDVLRLTGQRQPLRAQQDEEGAEGDAAESRKREREGGSGSGSGSAGAAGAAGVGAAAPAPALTVESKVEAAKRRFLERKRARAK